MKNGLATLALLAALPLLGTACGEGSASESSLVEIVSAEWIAGDDGGARAVVSGTWVRGVSTPPSCRLLEGRDGDASEWPEPSSNTSTDGNAFTKEFSAGGAASLDPLPEYHVRCSVNLSTGRTLETIAPVSGEPASG